MTGPGRALVLLSRPNVAGSGRSAALLSLAARYVTVVALCALCYWGSVRGELVHDDVWAIVNNPDVRAGSSLSNIFSNDFWGKRMKDNTSHKSYRPLCVLSFKLNVWLFGMTPLYFHLVNVLLHAAVCCLLLVTCESCVFSEPRPAFVTALLFAVHPVHTEAVSGIVGRADVLACLLFLLSFLCYVRSIGAPPCPALAPPTRSPLYLSLSLLLGTAAMLVKETGVTVFGVCLVYDALVLCHRSIFVSDIRLTLRVSRPLIKRAALLAAHVSLILWVRLWIMGGSMPLFSEQDNPASFSPKRLTRLLTYSFLLSFNAQLLFAPVTLCYDWQVGSIPLVESFCDVRNLSTLFFFLMMMSLCLHCFCTLQRSSYPELLVALLFLVFPFVPASNLFFRVGFVVAERVLYMPSMGYCVLVSHGLARLSSVVGRWGSAVLGVSTLLLLLLFSWKTVAQNQVWLNREALFRSGIQTLPHNAKVHYNFANFLKDTGRHQEAVRHYNIALRLYPRHASALNNLGTLTSDPQEAELFYRKALDINPQHNRALFNLGNLLKSRGEDAEAETLLKNSIRFGSHFADAYSSLASLFAEQRRFSEAKAVYLKGIEHCPESSDLHNNYGVFLVDTGEGALAAAHYRQAVRLKPEHYVAMVNLGRLLRSTNDNQEAELWYQRALTVERSVDVLSPLGALYYNTGRYEEALRVYREAALLRPKSTDIILALAQVLVISGRSSEADHMTRAVLLREPHCIECYRLLSAVSSKRGDHGQALELLNLALQQNISDPSVKAELLFSRGNQLREMHRLEDAFQSYTDAVQIKPDQSQAWMNMGGIQHIKGDYAAARRFYQKALVLSPGSKLLKENLAKLDRLERKSSSGG